MQKECVKRITGYMNLFLIPAALIIEVVGLLLLVVFSGLNAALQLQVAS